MKLLKTLSWLFLLGLFVRVLCYLLFSNELIVGTDASEYISLARTFADGDFYGILHPYWSPFYPFLVGLVSIFSNSNVFPALIVSIITGSLAVPATYLLVKQAYTEREAIIASIFAIFYPHLLNSVFELGTQNVYLLLIIASLIIFWKGLKENSNKLFFIAGILNGLAYLTRPEAFGYVFFFAFFIIIKKFFPKELITQNLFSRLAVLLLGFFLLSAPYLIYLRAETGSWTISNKIHNNTLAGNYAETSIGDPENLLNSTTVAEKTGKVLVKAIAINFQRFHKQLPYLIPPFLLMLIAIGLFRGTWNEERLRRELYLLTFCILTIFGYLLSVVEVNYFYVLLPITFGWIARGIVELENWIDESLQKFQTNKHLFFIRKPFFLIFTIIILNLYLLPLNLFMRPTEAAWQYSRYEQRDAGLWLKEFVGINQSILSTDFRPAFYAEGKYIRLSLTNLNDILTQARENNVDFVIFDERNLKNIPQLSGFINGTESNSELELVYQLNPRSGYQISIYKVKK